MLIRPKQVAQRQEANKDGGQKTTPALLRVMTDIKDLNLPNNCKLSYPDENNKMRMELEILPEHDSYWKGAR